MLNNKFYIFTCGISYSGKTTFTNKFLEEFPDFNVVSFDRCVSKLAKKHNLTYSQAFELHKREAFRLRNQKLYDYRHSNVILDQTLLNRSSRQKYMCMSEGRTLIAVHFDPCSLDELRTRVASRKDQVIPMSAVNTQLSSYVRPSKKEGFDYVLHYDENTIFQQLEAIIRSK